MTPPREANIPVRSSQMPATFPRLFEAQVERTPGTTAIVTADGEIDYLTLNARANRLAHLLLARGAGPEQVVALALPRSAEIIVAQLAVLKTGAAFLPIDPDYPAERIDFMMSDTRPLLTIDGPMDTTAFPDTDPPVVIYPDHAAYVVYTSGSTGRPKGVVVTHRGLVSLSLAQVKHFEVRPNDRVLQFSSPSFDASVLELCMTLPGGAALVVPPSGPLLGSALADVLAAQGITHLFIPPVALATVPDVALPLLRTLIVGGDACAADLIDRWAPGRRMINAYGPTETTVISTWSDPLVRGGGIPPIGGPILNTEVYVLGRDLRPVPAGVPGELYISGLGLARGYLRRPGLTAQRFAPNPFGAPGSRMYRTGDIVRARDNGALEFVGRVDHQVKIRGFRVEPGEIEALLLRHPAVGQAVVVAREEGAGLKRLVAYVVPVGTRDPSPSELRALVARTMPDYLMPSAFVVLESFPLSPNGKLDRAALPAPVAGSAAPEGYVEPRTATERAVAQIWAEVLGLERVGVEDDFFHLGGDSILAVKALARIRALFGTTLSGRAVFDAHTIARLTELLPERPNAAEPISRAPRGKPLPLSPAQRRLWSLDSGTEQNTGVGLRLSGPLDLAGLRGALDALAARHDALRTTFALVDGREVQVVAPRGRIPLRRIDLGSDSTALDAELTMELLQPFDLRRGPLTRALLVRLTDDEHVLVLAQHHIVTDGWTVALLVDELGELYAGNTPVPPPIQYPDYAVWHEELLAQTDLTAHLDYWRHRLDGMEVLALPADHPRPPLRTSAGAVHRRRLPAALVDRLSRVGRAHDATPFITLTAAVLVLLSARCHQRDIALGTVSSGRDRVELEGLAGFFVNTLVLRSWVGPDLPFTEFLDQVRETVLEAFAHDQVPFDRLVEHLQPDLDPSRTPLVQAVVALHPVLVRARQRGGLTISEYDLPRPSARFDVLIEFWPRGDSLELTVEYNTDLFDAATIEGMAVDLEALLHSVVADPDRSLARLADGGLDFPDKVEDAVRIRGFRVEPSVVEAALLRHDDVAGAAVVAVGDRLVAYVVPGAGSPAPAALRDFLSTVLPAYLVPGAFVVVDRIDRDALPPAPAEVRAEIGYVAPRTPDEAVLATVFAEVLGAARVGVRDNFFDLGGDSILSIQVVTHARQAGLVLTSREIFRHQTIAALAPHITREVAAATAQDPVIGPVPLTPIQRWFLDGHTVSPERFDQSMLTELGGEVDEGALRSALAALVEHHDALRMRFSLSGGGWQQRNAPVEAAVDLLSENTFDLGHGPLLRAELVDRRTLLLIAHHLVVDGVSWRILVEDLKTAYHQALRGETVRIGGKTTSFRDWALRLAEHTGAGGFDDELPYWRDMARSTGDIPVDRQGANVTSSTRVVIAQLGKVETKALFYEVPGAYRTQINDVLLTALGRVLGRWTGRGSVLVDLEGHGREELFDGVDLSRTVGWFTTLFPVALEVPDADWGTSLKAVKESLRAVPVHGIGYGALRYLSNAEDLGFDPRISFNYLGRFDSAQRDLDLTADPAAPRAHAVDIVGAVQDDVLRFTWYYSENLHDEQTITRLAGDLSTALREIIEHCAGPDAGGRTPSDFPLARLDQETVDQIAGIGLRVGDVEDIYPLTPMQAGMIFHGLSQGKQGAYFQQISFILDGVPDSTAFARAWQQVVDSTPVLRSSVVWEDVGEPVQIVHRCAQVPFTHLDWTGLSRAQREDRLRRFLAEDRVGFDLAAAPLMRIALARLSDTEVQVVWTFHHVLLDGWSVFHVLSDVLACHTGDRQMPDRPPFRNYVAWLQEQDDIGAERHWRSVLSDMVAPTPVPYDRSPANQHDTTSSERHTIELTNAESAELYEFARRHRVTPSTVVQGSWALLLSRYSRSDDVCFGSTVSGRPTDLADVDAMTGIFINTLPVRVWVDQSASVARWLQDLQAAQAESRRFEHVPLTRLQAWSGILGGANLFESIVVFENYPIDERATVAEGVRLRELAAVETTNFPLSATVYPGERLGILLGYEPEMFDASTVERLSRHLRALLTGMIADPDRTVARVPMLAHGERQRVLAEWNQTAAPLPESTLPELLAVQAAREPDATAVVFEGEPISYRELHARANRLAHKLITLGAGPERVVAVVLPRSVDLVVALLAVLKSGAAYLPVDPDLPRARIDFMLGDATVVTVLDSLRAVRETTGFPEHDPVVALRPAHPAYVIYTSGSTGRPKGVVVPHEGIVNRLRWMQNEYGLQPDDRVLQKTPSSFDVSVWEFFWPLLAGATLVVAKPEGHKDPAYLASLIRDERITTVHFVPSMLRAFLQDPTVAGCTGLRRVLCSGEALPAELVAQFHGLLDVRLYNLYGPTEASIDVTHWWCERGATAVPIGRPVWNTRLYVLDTDLRPVPPGVPGELYLAGVQLARGYLKRPGLTASLFIANPFGPPGSRMYRTGDLARWTANGAVEYLGRTDHQVKIRGFRIELGEVEVVLAGQPDVTECVVIKRDGRLVAYVTPAQLDVSVLREAAATALPDYMVPSAIVALDRLPLSPNGNLDRRALPDPDWSANTGAEYLAPRTETEEVLARIWAEVLGLDKVGVEDSFFAVGGDSILSMQITSRTKAAFEVDLSPRDVLTTRTVSALADLVENLVLRELEALAVGDGPTPQA